MAYISVPKPTGATYTTLSKSSIDIPQYGSAIYGLNKYGINNAYVNVSKPTGSSYTLIAKPT